LRAGLLWSEVRNVTHGMFVGSGAVDGASEQLAAEVRRSTSQGVPPKFPAVFPAVADVLPWSPDSAELLTTRSHPVVSR
jgi:hypothetical protein